MGPERSISLSARSNRRAALSRRVKPQDSSFARLFDPAGWCEYTARTASAALPAAILKISPRSNERFLKQEMPSLGCFSQSGRSSANHARFGDRNDSCWIASRYSVAEIVVNRVEDCAWLSRSRNPSLSRLVTCDSETSLVRLCSRFVFTRGRDRVIAFL